MFIHIDKDREDLIKQTGKLSLNVNPFVDSYTERDKMEYIVTYHNRELDCYPSSIFRCLITKNYDYLLIEDLTLRTKGVASLNEESLYLFLGWTINDAPKWAKMFGKDYVVLQTILPHCTEWFVECGYDLFCINNSYIKYYRGIKEVLEAYK